MSAGCDSGLLSSGEKTNAARLCFDSHEAALAFAQHGVEDANRWLAAHSPKLADRYEKLELEVVSRIVSVFHPHDYHLIFRCVPDGWPRAGTVHSDLAKVDLGGGGGEDHGKQDFVFVGITQLVQRPEKIIPSFVWLKRHHHVKDFFRHVAGLPFFSTLCVHFPDVIPKGELGMTAIRPSGDSGSVASAIQGRAQMGEDFKGDVRQGDWQGFSELELMHVLSSVSICFNDYGVWVTTDVRDDFPFQLVDTSLGLLDA